MTEAERTSAILAADAPMEHEPGPETMGAIHAAMPGYGRGRWMGRALLIGLSMAFLGLGAVVVSKLMARSPDTSPAAGLSTAESTGESSETGETEEAAPAMSPEEEAKDQYGRGNLAVKANEIEQAMEHYRNVLKLDPNHPGALAGLSASMIKAERYEDARPMLEELLRVAPEEGAAHLTLGLIAHKLDEPEARGAALKEFMKLAPNSPHRAKLLELLTGGTLENGEAPVGAE